MAAITSLNAQAPITLGTVYTVRTAVAQATTGQTDWLDVPEGAHFCTVSFNLTAAAGTTPIFLPSLKFGDPVGRDDGNAVNIKEHTAFTGITAAAMLVVDVGPGVTGIADDVTNAAAASSYVSLNANLPALMGLTVLNDRTTGNETYTYNIGVIFR